VLPLLTQSRLLQSWLAAPYANRFEAGFLTVTKLTPLQFDLYVDEMRTYRDKFIAHLDEEPVMQIPRLRLARKSVAFPYDYLLAHEDDGGFFPEGPVSARRYYLLHVNLARGAYAASE
jgi:hypothetical protein